MTARTVGRCPFCLQIRLLWQFNYHKAGPRLTRGGELHYFRSISPPATERCFSHPLKEIVVEWRSN
ncbi:hypothetical protein C8R44DRAFT_792041 [Mycena epipterygia]|nr:hypothetical protein C8R44DRAFT_792041 [Mycena epipterygia]